MPIREIKVEGFFKSLEDAESWDDVALEHSIEYTLRDLFRAPVMALHHASHILAYYIDLGRELDLTIKESMIFFVRGSSNDFKDINNTISIMLDLISKEGLNDKPNAIFLWNYTTNQIEYMEDTFQLSFVSEPQYLKEMLKDFESKKILISKIKVKALTMGHCPFHHLGPCKPDIFVGRSELLEEILTGVSNGFFISGGRRMGKTSILLKLQDMIKENKNKSLSEKYDSLFVDCSTFQSYELFIKGINKKITRHFGKNSSYLINFENPPDKINKSSKKMLLLLLDEMDSLVEKDNLKSWYKESFYKMIQAKTNILNFRVVFAGFRHVSKMINNREHPLFNVCEGKYLGPLTLQEVRKLVSIPFLKLGIRLEPKDDIITDIYRYSGGHPSVVQFIAKELFKAKQDNKITKEILAKVIKNKTLTKFILDSFMENTTPLERLICILALNSNEIDADKILNCLSDEKISLKSKDKNVHESLNHLEMNSIFKQDGEKYSFLFPMMSDILKGSYYSQQKFETLKKEI